MKRIVQCPKCEAKLSVFDLGKPIHQKCPKCGNTFDVAPEGAADAAEPPTPAASPAPDGDAPAKEIKLKPPVAAPRPAAPAPAAPPEPAAVESGISFMHVLLILALLFTVIVVQVVTFKKTQSQLNALSSQVQAISKKTAQP